MSSLFRRPSSSSSFIDRDEDLSRRYSQQLIAAVGWKWFVTSYLQFSTMLLGKKLIGKTHYDILGVREDANYEEIRTSYRSAILDSHPDKLQKTSETSFPNHESGNRFLEVQRAWEILSNSKSRVAYDSELQASWHDFVAAEDVGLEDLMVENTGEFLELFYQCRCGDYFSIDSSELEEMGYQLLRDGSDAFAKCQTCRGRISSRNADEEDSGSDVVVSEIRSRAMEAKTRRKASFSMDSFNWIISPSTGELFTAPNAMQKNEDSDHEEKEDFFSVGSCLSRCSTVRSVEEFFSVKTQFSRCSSLSRLDCRDFRTFVVQEFWHGIDYQELLRRRSIIQEFCHCKGWPFGLCRKALLLPPLPKSPSESWSWRKGARLVKLP
ncbi:unnamed protein product [Camellia sinensis]